MDWKVPDWQREMPQKFWDPSRKLLASIRAHQRYNKKSNLYSKLLCKVCVLRHRFWSAVCGADIPINSNLGGGLLMPHPNGIVIHQNAIVGANCLILQQVTLTSDVKLGFHVDVGAGAKILGPLSVGNNVKIGANAVVISDVSDDDTQVGIPSRSTRK